MICNDFKTAYIKAYAEKHFKEIISDYADNDKEVYSILRKNILDLKGEKK